MRAEKCFLEHARGCPNDSGAMLSVDAGETRVLEGSSGRDGIAGWSTETGEGHFERDVVDVERDVRGKGSGSRGGRAASGGTGE